MIPAIDAISTCVSTKLSSNAVDVVKSLEATKNITDYGHSLIYLGFEQAWTLNVK